MAWRLPTVAIVAISALAAGCGGGDDPPADQPPTPLATGAPSVQPARTVEVTTATVAERSWVLQLCGLDKEFDGKRNQIPGWGQDTSTLSLEQRHERGRTFWPAALAVNEEYLTALASITPPPGAETLQQRVREFTEAQVRELRRSIAEIDTIFASPESVDKNNDLIRASESTAGVDAEFRARPALLALYQTLPECITLPTR